jgi:hypothetical protein
MSAKSQAQRLQLAAEAIANLSDENVDHLAWIVEQARLAGKTPQEAVEELIDAAASLRQPDPISEPGPAVPGKEV